MLSSSSFVLKKQATFQEEEHYWLLPTTYPPAMSGTSFRVPEEGELMAPNDRNRTGD
jgi:hypothetical protein